VVLLVSSGSALQPYVVLLPIWIVLILCLALGAGFIAAALTVKYRDIQHILPIVIPFLLYASPVAYDVMQIPADYRTAFYLINPLAALLAGLRASLLPGSSLPPLPFVVWSATIALSLFALGAAVFKRTERSFADVV